jgi:hypothetical protein
MVIFGSVARSKGSSPSWMVRLAGLNMAFSVWPMTAGCSKISLSM